jgi:hypothetical protein
MDCDPCKNSEEAMIAYAKLMAAQELADGVSRARRFVKWDRWCCRQLSRRENNREALAKGSGS